MSEETTPTGKKIALDCMGGDLGPSEAVAGAALALREGFIGPNDKLILVGHEDNLRQLAAEHRILKSKRIEYKHAASVVNPDDAAMTVIKSKRDSSMLVALDMLKAGQADLVISTGNTKALVAAGTIKVRPMEGAERPALAAVMPRRDGHFVMLDVGANPEAKPEHLVHNAVLGSIYAQSALGITNPRVGLLSVGTEEGKGGARINRTHTLLKAMSDKINYVGPVEGFDVFGDVCDVVVTDGFTGNVILKTLEGLVYMVRDMVGKKVKSNPVYLAGGIAMFPLLRDLKGKLKPEKYGGAPLLGLSNLVMKAHGSSNRQSIASAIRLGLEALGHDANRRMLVALAEANAVISSTPEGNEVLVFPSYPRRAYFNYLMNPAQSSVFIRSLGVYTPERKLTNDDLSKIVDTNDEWIKSRSGIAERRIAAPNENPSDMGAKASAQALQNAGLKPEDIDLLIVATMTPDVPFPSTACILQSKLGLRRDIPAFDVSAACSGFIFALQVGTDMLRSGNYRRALIVGAEKLSGVLDWQDRTTCVLFGDGAGAAILELTDKPNVGILGNMLGSDGYNAELIHSVAGGSAKPATPETIQNREHCLRMNGKEVFKLAVRVMSESCEKVLSSCGVTSDQVAWFIPHQANSRILEAVAGQLNVGLDRFPSNLEHFGNTSAASIPLALEEAWREGKIKHGDLILLVAFGSGLTWGATLLRWHEPKK